MPGINDSKCVLVIGATAGIGRALALAIHDLPSKPIVIVAGRRQERLDEVVEESKATGSDRLDAFQVDVGSGTANLESFVTSITGNYPELDTVIFSAGIQHRFDFTKPESIDLDAASDEININYLAIFTLIKLFLPHFLKLSAEGKPSFFIPISSGLAIYPVPHVPNYCATKAALHSLCLTLRNSLANTNVNVIEILPPLVESELHDHQGITPMLSKVWVPLSEYIPMAMEGLQRGDIHVVTPPIVEAFEKYERPRVEHVLQMGSGGSQGDGNTHRILRSKAVPN